MKKPLLFFFFFFSFLISSDAQWQQLGPFGCNIISIFVDGNNLYAETSRGAIFLSTNNGTSWIPVNSSCASSVQCLAIKSGNIFSGTGGGLIEIHNNQTEWSANNGVSYFNVHCI